ncbi:hypothetical protein NUV66_00535 [Pseudomonas sp. 32.2.56]|nr:hypothetical protein [Pseudomonas sp. 32.2.56]
MNLPRLNDQQSSVIWSARLHEPEWMPEMRALLKSKAAESGTAFGKWLLGECAISGMSTAHVRELEARLGTDHTLRNVLRSITQRVRDQIPGFPLARIAIAVTRAANPINPDIYTSERIQRSGQLVHALQQGLKLDIDALNTDERIGLLLMSAAYNGGLLDVAQLNAMISMTLGSIEWVAGVPEIRLTLSIHGKAGAEFRQWFPDPATLALLIRCADDVQKSSGKLNRRNWHIRCVGAFLRKAGIPEQDQPQSLTALLDLFRMQMQLRLPQILVNFACRQEFVSQSLRPSCWGNIFGQTDLVDPAGTYDDESISDKAEDSPDAPAWLLELCQRIRADQSVELPLQAEPDSELSRLTQGWVAYMQGGGSAYGHGDGLGRKTIDRYARVLGAALASQLDGTSIFELEIDALEIVYESALDAQATDSKRRTLAKAIQEFHTFLQRRYSYPPISPYSILGIGKCVTRVDARIISEDQYQLVLQALGTCGLELRTPRLVTAARLLLILGFRLGLRRNEALKLRLCDLHLPEFSTEERARIQARHPNMRRLTSEEQAGLELPVDLLIRPHAQRGLKTQNAVRRFPLRDLLEPDELTLLIDWYRERQSEEHKNPISEFLFCIPQLRTQWISESCLFPALHNCMRAVTGSEFLHYHHLRHSCATWLLLKLMRAQNGLSPELIFRDLPLTTRWLRDDLRLRTALLPTEGPTRRIVHIVSAILGHGSPKTTLLHYVHSLPQVMAMMWQWNPQNWIFNAANVAQIGGVSQPTKKAEPVDGISVECGVLLDIIGRIAPLKELKRTRKKARPGQVQQVEQNWAIGRIQAIESMLAYASYAEQTGREVNLGWVEFAAEERSLMLERARYIRGMQQRPGTSDLLPKHRLQRALHADDPSYLSLLPSPPKHGGREAVTEYVQHLYELLEGPTSERAQRVIDDFVERCWKTEATLRFQRNRDEEHAQDYLWLLTAIGIPARSIELIVYDTNKPKSIKSYWRQQLGNTRRPFSQHAPESNDVANLHLGIRAKLELKGEVKQNLHSGAALRYLMLMASIDWHFRA